MGLLIDGGKGITEQKRQIHTDRGEKDATFPIGIYKTIRPTIRTTV